MAYTYEDKLNFIADLYCPARMMADETGCSWELILAQAAHETGWGEKILPGTNNVFNIKAGSGWKGETKIFHVWEKDGKGNKYWTDDPFRVYGSYLESLRDRDKFLRENPRYAEKGLFDPEVKGNFEREAKALKKAGYATDEDYAGLLKKVFDGRSMKRAIAMAQKRGCGPILPVVEVVLKDGALVAIANARVMATQDGKEAEIATDAHGRIAVRITPKSGDLALKVFDKEAQKWIALDTLKMPAPAKSVTLTVIAPTFTRQTSTREHEKKASSKPAPPAGKGSSATSAAKSSAPSHAGPVKMHKVEKGESLALIAEHYKMRYKTIADANGITSPYIIRPDQMLKIPGVAPDASGAAKTAAVSPKHEEHKDDGASGGISLAELGKLISDGIAKLDTIFLRNQGANPQTDLMHSSRAPWLNVAQDEFEKGVRRRAGKQNDQRILEYFKATPTLDKASASVDETPYCAAFVNWCLASAGFKGSNSALAVSFAKWGRPTKDNKPALGAVALIKFPGGGHHVTFVAGISANKQRIATLGGNQGKAHEVSHSHCGRTMVVAYRYPADYPDYDDDYVLHDVTGDNAAMTAASTH